MTFKLKPLTQYDLKLLHVFQTVVDSGGLSAAESSLNIGRSSISLYLSSLEQRFKFTLCLRGRQGFRLTEQGAVVYKALQQLHLAHQQFSQTIAELNQDVGGTLRLLLADQLEPARQRVLSSALRNMNTFAPELEIQLELLPLGQIEQALLKQEADVALIPGYRRIDQLDYTLAFHTPVYLCCGANHPLFNVADQDIELSLLQQYKTVHPGLDINPEGRRLLDALNCSAKAYAFDLRLALILSGGYLGFLPDTIALPYQQQHALRLLCPQKYQYPFEQYLVCHRSEPAHGKCKQLIKLIIQEITTI